MSLLGDLFGVAGHFAPGQCQQQSYSDAFAQQRAQFDQSRLQQYAAYQNAINQASQTGMIASPALQAFLSAPRPMVQSDPCEVAARKELEEYLGPLPEVHFTPLPESKEGV